MDQATAKQEVMEPVIGRSVQVTGGRKVPKGTTGSVFYRRDGRVGLKTPAGVIHFVDEKYAHVVYPDLPAGVEPLDWVAFRDQVNAAEQAVMAKYAHFNVGDAGVSVQTDQGPVTGSLWWRKERRISIRTSDRKDGMGRYIDVVWADVGDIIYKEGFLLTHLAGVELGAQAGVAPYCDVSAIEVKGDTIKALDIFGTTVLEFPSVAILDATPYLRDDVVARIYPKP
jgi:hypothetical protein